MMVYTTRITNHYGGYIASNNYGRFIKETIDSVLDQSLKALN